MSSLFELHDRNRFEIIAFSFGPIVEDEFRIKLKNSFDQFIDIQHLREFQSQSLRESYMAYQMTSLFSVPSIIITKLHQRFSTYG